MNKGSPHRIPSEAEEGRFASMYGIHVVAATGEDRTEFWAVAATPTKALVEVLQRLPAGWMVTLTGESLTLQEGAELHFRPNEVRKLGLRNQAPYTPQSYN